MPASKYFPWYTTHTFFDSLVVQFGSIISHDETNRILYFVKGVEYHYNCDADKIDALEPNADIDLSAHVPDLWKTRGFFDNRQIFQSCGTSKMGSESIVVHNFECECFEEE
jgi:hypothetical protein